MGTSFTAMAALSVLLMTGGAQVSPVDPALRGVKQETEAWLGLEQAQELFVCKTRISFTPGHGTQVTYINPDGTVYLWYPGNSVMLPGKWRLTPRATPTKPPKEYVDICFSYPANSRNPVTGVVGSQWQCMPADALHRATVDSAKGDVFGLTTRTAVPFRLSRERTTIAELEKHLESLGTKSRKSGRSPNVGCAKGEVQLDWMPNG